VRHGRPGAEPHSLGEGIARLVGFAVFHQRDAEIIQRTEVAGVDHQRGPAGLDSPLAVAELSVRLPEMGIKVGTAREGDRPHYPLDCEPGVAILHRQDAGEVQCVGIIRLLLKHFAIFR